MIVAYSAFDNGVPYAQLPKELTKMSSLQKGIEKGLFHWDKLPHKHKKNVDLALLAKKKSEFLIVLRNVTDKEKLWTEWACKDSKVVPKSIRHRTWQPAGMNP